MDLSTFWSIFSQNRLATLINADLNFIRLALPRFTGRSAAIARRE
jgi:hypothetical protein